MASALRRSSPNRFLSNRFPPKPRILRGRQRELETLSAAIRAAHPAEFALVGTGGSGKSALAAALGHRLYGFFGGEIDWFRAGALSYTTLVAMLAMRFGARRRDSIAALRRRLGERPRLIVLDNHEDDHAVAALVAALAGLPVSWVLTARRCLLGGVQVFPVTAPLIVSGARPFPRVAALTRILRWNPLALSLADGLVGSGTATAASLNRTLIARGAATVQVIEDEDDLPEVRELVDWVWSRLRASEQRVLGVLAHSGGDHVDLASLGALAGVRHIERCIGALCTRRLVQEPLRQRFALHATVRRVIRGRTLVDAGRFFEHYVCLLEAAPERLELEQTHLFAAMDYAQEHGDLAMRVRLAALLQKLGM